MSLNPEITRLQVNWQFWRQSPRGEDGFCIFKPHCCSVLSKIPTFGGLPITYRNSFSDSVSNLLKQNPLLSKILGGFE